jgi:uncharacterized membrane protein YhdT
MKKLPFEVDRRFSLCTRDMLISFAIQIAYMLIIIGCAYGLGGRPLSEYQFIFGMPSWWFLLLVILVCFICIIAFTCLKVFSHMSVEAYIDDEQGGDK